MASTPALHARGAGLRDLANSPTHRAPAPVALARSPTSLLGPPAEPSHAGVPPFAVERQPHRRGYGLADLAQRPYSAGLVRPRPAARAPAGVPPHALESPHRRGHGIANLAQRASSAGLAKRASSGPAASIGVPSYVLESPHRRGLGIGLVGERPAAVSFAQHTPRDASARAPTEI
eukprot:1711580-Prymnesium_polylepis.1